VTFGGLDDGADVVPPAWPLMNTRLCQPWRQNSRPIERSIARKASPEMLTVPGCSLVERHMP
jgi:hypothetical protein